MSVLSTLDPKVAALIELHEGRVPHAYEDSLGYITIGIGHLIDKRKGGSLPDEFIDALLYHDIEAHGRPLFEALPWAENLDPVRKAVLIDMAFNLGVNGLLKWPIFLSQVKAGQYEDASRNMLGTKWAGQVKTRAKRLAQMMLTGQWPPELA